MSTEIRQKNETTLAGQSSVNSGFDLSGVVGRVEAIQHVMKSVMRDGEHFGEIPGCGKKKVLMKSGAEKLASAFRLVPKYEVEKESLGDGHREYTIVCRVEGHSGEELGEGVGSCSTMESKYRYRTEFTQNQVPQDYWKTKDKALLGGPQFSPKKSEGRWYISEKVTHEDPADYYNTCLKMAKKRALIDAVLTVTAASDLFSQDLEDLPSNEEIEKMTVRGAEKPFVRAQPLTPGADLEKIEPAFLKSDPPAEPQTAAAATQELL